MQSASKVLLSYITVSGLEQARSLGQCLIERKLAACINILPQMESIYPWKGKIENSQECVLIAKTSEAKKEALTAAVLELHSYEVPCVLFLEADSTNPAYTKWLMGNLE